MSTISPEVRYSGLIVRIARCFAHDGNDCRVGGGVCSLDCRLAIRTVAGWTRGGIIPFEPFAEVDTTRFHLSSLAVGRTAIFPPGTLSGYSDA